MPEAYFSPQNVFPNIYIHLYSQGLGTVELSQPVSKICRAKAVILNITGAELWTTTPKMYRKESTSPEGISTQPAWSGAASKGNQFQINNIKHDGPNQ